MSHLRPSSQQELIKFIKLIKSSPLVASYEQYIFGHNGNLPPGHNALLVNGNRATSHWVETQCHNHGFQTKNTIYKNS